MPTRVTDRTRSPGPIPETGSVPVLSGRTCREKSLLSYSSRVREPVGQMISSRVSALAEAASAGTGAATGAYDPDSCMDRPVQNPQASASGRT